MADASSIPAPAQVAAPKTVGQAAPDTSRTVTSFVMVVAILYFGREVLLPVVLALLLAFLLAPLVGLLRRARLGRVPSVVLGVVVALGLILGIGAVIVSQITELTSDLPRYASTIEAKVVKVRTFTVGQLTAMADKVGPHAASPASQGQAGGAGVPAGGQRARPASSGNTETPLAIAQRYLTTVLSTVLSLLATLGVVLIVAIFALLQREDLRDRLIRLVGSDDLHRTTLAMDDGGRRLSRYFVTQLSINTAFGLVIGLGLLLIGVPNPVLWGILSALLRFVPYVGSIISAVLPMGLAAAVEPGWSMVLWTLGLYVAIEGVTGQVIEPMVYGHSTGLSPFSVVVAAIFWSWLWGPVGLILSTPLTLCLVVMGRHVKRLGFLDVLLGDRPALTPVESFYQRILAGDADEVQDHAELLLKEGSLSTYYDDVALEGLQLAANDAQRGVLGHDQLDRVRTTVGVLVDALGRHDDVQPPRHQAEKAAPTDDDEAEDIPQHQIPNSASLTEEGAPVAWQGTGSVLCIAGRGPLDEAASMMLVQLLAKHGLGGRLVGYAEASRDHIATLDVRGAAMVCVSYLDISGSPAHLRYLIRRLRDRMPTGAPILVGLWPSGDVVLRDETVRTTIGADYFTSSLTEAVNACLKAAHVAAGVPDATPAGGTLPSPEFNRSAAA